jgi:uncharacterized Zn finger protein
MWYGEFFPRSHPRAARGGIKAQSKRGTFGQSWWAQRWIAVLESFDIGARLGRGRSYARSGQVLSIDVAEGEVTAKVQGSQPKPYSVTIAMKGLTAKQWGEVVQALSEQARFTAKLLAGEMPGDIEEVFQEVGLSLFPSASADLITECSCPDWSNPCKHVAAVYYLLGEEFDRDPFLLFRLRGLGREELLQRLSRAAPPSAEEPQAEASSPAEPLPVDPSVFWASAELPDDAFGEALPPPVSGAWLRRLGGFPFWRGETRLQDALEPVYQAASARGLQAFLGERNEFV